MAQETTTLSKEEEARFRQWVVSNKIADWDWAPYDYRGYFKETNGAPIRFGIDHFTDKFKRHGHESFSAESQYSRGPQDGGQWIGETLINPPMPSHVDTQHRADGSLKGPGFLGALRRPDGRVSSELSVGVNVDGREIEIPLLVPTLSKEEVDHLLQMDLGTSPPDQIVRKAVEFALQRRDQGKSYFADQSDVNSILSHSRVYR